MLTLDPELDLDVRIRAIASDLLGMRYGGDVGFPRAAPGLPSRFVNPRAARINCSSLTAYILAHLYAHESINAGRLYADLQIFDDRRPWSPIEGIVRQRLGDEVPAPVIGCWHLVQLWRSAIPGQLAGGHACLAYLRPDGVLVVLESVVRDATGPAWRLTTWSELTHSRAARLAVLRP